jgi:hypothetical protein
MQINFDNKRWLNRQSFFAQMIVFTIIFFIASVFANWVTDYLFDGISIFQKTGKEIGKFLMSKFSSALMMGIIITVLLRNYLKRNQK